MRSHHTESNKKASCAALYVRADFRLFAVVYYLSVGTSKSETYNRTGSFLRSFLLLLLLFTGFESFSHYILGCVSSY